jgi:putative methylcobalamin:coenzyme M methyltransferase
MKLKIHKNDKMTPDERARAIAEKRDYDRIIMDPFLGEIKARLIGKNTRQYWRNEDNLVMGDVEAVNRFGLDGMGVGPNAYGIAEAMGIVPHYPEQGLIYVEKHPIDSINEVGKLKDITLDSGSLRMYYNATARLREIADGFCGVGVSVSGPITLAGFVLGTDKLLKSMIKSPDKVHLFLRYITENVKYVVDKFSALDVGFSMADPIASCTMISPKMYKDFAYPYTVEISLYIKERSGRAPSYHICGNTRKIWEYIKELDIGVFSVDNEMDIDETCEFFADSKMIAGNVAPVATICNGSKLDIEREVKKCILAGRKCKNGFMLAPGCNLPLVTTDEKIDMFLDAGRKYGIMI